MTWGTSRRESAVRYREGARRRRHARAGMVITEQIPSASAGRAGGGRDYGMSESAAHRPDPQMPWPGPGTPPGSGQEPLMNGTLGYTRRAARNPHSSLIRALRRHA